MIFYGYTPESFIDYPGSVASVFFVGGCNFRCRYCFNPGIVLLPEKTGIFIQEEEAINLIQNRIPFIDAIVISGGEPTAYRDELQGFLRELRKLPIKIGLCSNGSNPDVIEGLLESALLDFIAIDYKAPKSKYANTTMTPACGAVVLYSIERAVVLAQEYEIRITVHPDLHNEDDLKMMAQELREVGAQRIALQIFKPWETLDATLSARCYTEDQMIDFASLFEGKVTVR